MGMKEFWSKAAAGIYVSGISVIVLAVALVGYIMFGTQKNSLEGLIVTVTVITLVAGVLEMCLTIAKGYRPLWDNMTILYSVLTAASVAVFAKSAASYIQNVSVGLDTLTVSFEVTVVAYVAALVTGIIAGFFGRRKDA